MLGATRFLLIVMVSFGLSQAFRNASQAGGIDFYQFWATGRAVVEERVSDIYSERGRVHLGGRYLAEAEQNSSQLQRSVAVHRRVFETTATPFLYTAFGVLSSSDYDRALGSYRSILLGCFVASVVGIARLLRYSIATTLAALALFLLWFEPLASDLRVGNVGCIQLASVVAYAYLRILAKSKLGRVLAGVLLGLLLAFKPNVMFVVLAALVGTAFMRDWRWLLKETAGVVIGVLFAVVVSALACRSFTVWLEWFDAAWRLSKANPALELGNFSPQVVLAPQFGQHSVVVLLLAGAAASALGIRDVLGLRRGQALRRMPSEARRLVWLLSVGSLGTILVPQLAWLHYFVLAVPGLLFVLSNLNSWGTAHGSRWQWVGSAIAWVGLSGNLLSSLGQQFTMHGFAAILVLSAFALLCVLCASAGIAMLSSRSGGKRGHPVAASKWPA